MVRRIIASFRGVRLIVAALAVLALAFGAVAFANGPGDQSGPDAFRDNHNGTVTDLSTGRMWQQASFSGSQTQAETYCASLTLARHHDWHLPTMYQLLRVLDFSQTSGPVATPTLDWANGGGNDSLYWSSTQWQGSPTIGTVLRVSEGIIFEYPDSYGLFAHCVR